MYQKDIDEFIEKNISNFQLNGTGWTGLVRKMLFEFCIAGWDLSVPVGGKEKFGGLRCYISLEDKALEERILRIVAKYAVLSGATCEQCGEAGKQRVDKVTRHEQTLCRKCYLSQASAFPANKPPDLLTCMICGYVAVHDSMCDFCHSATYYTGSKIYRPSQYYSSEADYIKERQIEVYLDMDDEIALSRKTKNYLLSSEHQIIFNSAELEKFLIEQSEE